MKRQLGLSEMVRRRTARASRRATRGALGFWAWSNAGAAGSGDPRRARRGRETRAERSQRGRRGSTLLIVMALLGMLTLLGMLYFTFATQEQANATNFAVAEPIDDGDDIDAIFDAAIKQLIQGAGTSQPNSVLSYRHSILGTYFGKDLHPFSGAGVNYVYLDETVVGVDLNGDGDATDKRVLCVDQNLDGTPEFTSQSSNLMNLLEPNDSAAAQPNLAVRAFANLPAGDVDYTYPDINNMFLAYKSYVWDPITLTRRLVLKPSFHRPELLRDDAGIRILNWETHTANAVPNAPFSARGRLMRPHPDHLYVWRQNTSSPPEGRFLSDYNPADAGPIASLSCLRGFPFTNVPPAVGAGSGPVPAIPVPRTQGVWSMTTSGGANISYQYDSDNDGDGVNEGVWIDMDLRMLERSSDNKTYVPMISFTVYDLDALLNLNIHGNLSGDTKTSPTTIFGNSNDIHRSSMGLGPNEVNLLHALDAVPGIDFAALSATSDYVRYYNHNPSGQRELANMELWWLLTGRMQWPAPPSTAPPQILVGRHGEASRLQRVLATAGGSSVISVNQWGNQSDYFPFAGFTYSDEANREGGDDNQDEDEGRQNWVGGTTAGTTLPFGHPLALNGRGRSWGVGAGLKSNRTSAGGLTGNRTRWQSYDGMGVGYDAKNNLANAAWLSYLGGNLMTNTMVGVNYKDQNTALGADEHLVHDTLEISLEPKSQLRPYDEAFESIESIWLHMSSGDRTAVGLTSRVGNLMPSNFMNATLLDPNYSHEISQRFAANTWDTKTFALMNAPDPATATSTRRTWEWNVDFDGDGQREWPPQFNPTTNNQPDVFDPTSGSYRPENAYGPRDPFRPQLRRLLSTEYGDTKVIRHPMRLSINEFLDVEQKPNVAGSPFTSPLQYRPLTPHITIAPATPFTALPQPQAAASPGAFDPIYNLPPFPPQQWTVGATTFSQDAVQEFWAQRDRQQMARDIYVMLYTFCGGNDSANVTTTSGFTVHPANVRRQMAQFAVNMVDALDRDDVITAFEFDNNLLNGWNLDDDPSTVEGGLATGERDVVYGVEAQQLTFSEVAWYRQKVAADNPQTSFSDGGTEFNFLQFELRSVHPQNIKLSSASSTTAATGIWRILRDDNGNGRFDNTATEIENAVVFQGNDPALTITPGQTITLASSDSNGSGVASLFVDHTGSMTSFELVAPNPAAPPLAATYYDAGTNPTPAPAANLDLLYGPQATWYILAGGGSPGDLLSRTNSPATNPDANKLGSDKTHFALERRLNPYLPTLSLAANPFVPVDHLNRVTLMDLDLNGSVTNQSQAATRLADPSLRSLERRQPLDGGALAFSPGVPPCPLLNTLGQDSSNNPPTFDLLFPHYDRDFASVIELFDIPLRGPGQLTQIVRDSLRPASLNPSTGKPGQLERRKQSGVATFGAAVLLDREDWNHDNMLIASDDTNGNGIMDGGESDSNGVPGFDFGNDLNNNGVVGNTGDAATTDSSPYHFHRLLSLVEVPTRTHRQLGDPLKVNRIPGKVNFNTMRDRHVLAALIDDREIVGTEEDANRNQVLDAGEDANGDNRIGLADVTGAGDTIVNSSGTTVPRDLWNLLLEARDGIDPITKLPLPISGASRPFRDLANLSARTSAIGQSPVDDTILRRYPSADPEDGRRLFELDTKAEFTANPPTVPSGIRHRLMSKMIGNSTTRSNVFVVFATIGMFECYENPTTGAVRIGGQMDVDNDGSPDTHRAVFIIDRSAAEEAYDKGSGTFDWKKLVLARQRVN